MDKVGYGLRTDGKVWVDGWTRGMGGLLVIIHDSIYGQVVRYRKLLLAYMCACECQLSWEAYSLCRSYEVKDQKMQEKNISEIYFWVFKICSVTMKDFLENAPISCVLSVSSSIQVKDLCPQTSPSPSSYTFGCWWSRHSEPVRLAQRYWGEPSPLGQILSPSTSPGVADAIYIH